MLKLFLMSMDGWLLFYILETVGLVFCLAAVTTIKLFLIPASIYWYRNLSGWSNLDLLSAYASAFPKITSPHPAKIKSNMLHWWNGWHPAISLASKCWTKRWTISLTTETGSIAIQLSESYRSQNGEGEILQYLQLYLWGWRFVIPSCVMQVLQAAVIP